MRKNRENREARYEQLEERMLLHGDALSASAPIDHLTDDVAAEVSEVVPGNNNSDDLSIDTNTAAVDDYFADMTAEGEGPVNLNCAADVDDNGNIEPLDALEVINALNRHGIGASVDALIEAGVPEEVSRRDVNGDGSLTPLDALLVINALNSGDTTVDCGPDTPADGAENIGPVEVVGPIPGGAIELSTFRINTQELADGQVVFHVSAENVHLDPSGFSLKLDGQTFAVSAILDENGNVLDVPAIVGDVQVVIDDLPTINATNADAIFSGLVTDPANSPGSESNLQAKFVLDSGVEIDGTLYTTETTEDPTEPPPETPADGAENTGPAEVDSIPVGESELASFSIDTQEVNVDGKIEFTVSTENVHLDPSGFSLKLDGQTFTPSAILDENGNVLDVPAIVGNVRVVISDMPTINAANADAIFTGLVTDPAHEPGKTSRVQASIILNSGAEVDGTLFTTASEEEEVADDSGDIVNKGFPERNFIPEGRPYPIALADIAPEQLEDGDLTFIIDTDNATLSQGSFKLMLDEQEITDYHFKGPNGEALDTPALPETFQITIIIPDLPNNEEARNAVLHGEIVIGQSDLPAHVETFVLTDGGHVVNLTRFVQE